MAQKISFQSLFLTFLFLFKKYDWGVFETITDIPKKTSFKSVAALSVHLDLVDSVSFHAWEKPFL